MVQFLLRKTQSFVGARSSCSIGGPRTDWMSASLSPISRSTPCVPTCAASSLVSAGESAAGRAVFRTGSCGCGAGSGGMASAVLACSELLGRSSGGGPGSAQLTTSIALSVPIRCHSLLNFMLVRHELREGMGGAGPPWSDKHTTQRRPSIVPTCRRQGRKLGAPWGWGLPVRLASDYPARIWPK